MLHKEEDLILKMPEILVLLITRSSSEYSLGGRLGPTIGETGEPDLRNLLIHLFFCDQGDIVIVCSGIISYF